MSTIEDENPSICWKEWRKHHIYFFNKEEMRKQMPEHPSPVRDLRNIYDSGFGRKKRKDGMHWEISQIRLIVRSTKLSQKLRNQQKKNSWHIHQSISSTPKRGRRQWGKCTDLDASKAKWWTWSHPKVMPMYCDECTECLGQYVFLCNNSLGDKNILCHIKYHNQYHSCTRQEQEKDDSN